MRQKALFLAGLPAASAISLANFQPLDSSQIPYICEIPYYNQIPSCLVSDFDNGCSGVCEMALEAVAQSVIRACKGVSADPESLLETVLNGGIIAALCPVVSATSSKHGHHDTTTSANLVTIAPTSPGVQVTSTASTTTSTLSTTTTDQSTPTSVVVAPSTVASSTDQLSTSNLAPVTSSSTATPTQTPVVQEPPGGGGDPFGSGGQNTGSGASAISGGSALALVIAACACVILG